MERLDEESGIAHPADCLLGVQATPRRDMSIFWLLCTHAFRETQRARHSSPRSIADRTDLHSIATSTKEIPCQAH